jgi:hypothetical protein
MMVYGSSMDLTGFAALQCDNRIKTQPGRSQTIDIAEVINAESQYK